ncbi:MAG: DUF501 domain-containing protein [Planctomycetota bacterium]
MPQVETHPPHPAVERVYPLRRPSGRVEPFPTIYYLRDAGLMRAMSELERHHHVREIERRLAEDAELMAAYHADHAAYRDTRWAMLTEPDRAAVEASPSLRRSFRGGIAGIADFNYVKCLHAQYAYHLARGEQGGTTAGRLIDALLSADSG